MKHATLLFALLALPGSLLLERPAAAKPATAEGKQLNKDSNSANRLQLGVRG